MWYLLTSGNSTNQAKIEAIGPTLYKETKFIVKQDNLVEFLSKVGNDWLIEKVQEWTPKVLIEQEKEPTKYVRPRPLSDEEVSF